MRAVAVYALFALLWIAGSDTLLASLVDERQTLVAAGTYKGWLFVAVTSVLLYWLMRHLAVTAQRSATHQALQVLKSIADSSSDSIFAKDRGGRFLLFNRGASRAAGVPAADVIGKFDHDLFPASDAEKMKASDRRVMESGISYTYESDVETEEGTRSFLSTKSPLRGLDGQATGVFVISRDITELKRLVRELGRYRDNLEQLVEQRTTELGAVNQALRQTVADLEAFSYSVSHDLRAPLAAIGGFAQALRENEAAALSERGRSQLDRIVAGSHKMETMINDILSYSRTSKAQMRRQAVCMKTLVAEVVDEARQPYPRTPVDIGELPQVCADTAMLRQILHNLVGNALKFSGKRPDARVEIGATAVEGGTEVFVRDNGVGFEPDYAGKLWGLFQRLHSQAEFAGTGVGLAIAKRLVQRHGGQIRAESIPGGWTTFAFTLPAQAGAADAA